MSDIAIVLIRGTVNVSQDVKDALHMLRLRRKHVCVVVPDNPTNRGMINKVKDLITWGAIDEQTLKLLQEKRGEKDVDGKEKPFFRLHPPIGGFERKGIKQSYNVGGALGNREKDINILLKKMIL